MYQQIDDEENDGECDHDQVESGRAGKEGSFFVKTAVPQRNVPDILRQAADALAVDACDGYAASGDVVTLFDRDGDVARRGRDVFAVGVVVKTVFDGRYHEISVAAGNERIFEGLRTARSAGRCLVGTLEVVHFEVRREVDLRRFQHGEIAVARDRDDERSGFVRLDAFLAQFGRNLEVAHAAGEGSRCSGGQVTHRHGDGRRADALADGLELVEEIVEDRHAAAARRADPDLADHLGRVDGQRAALLRDQDPLAQQC